MHWHAIMERLSLVEDAYSAAYDNPVEHTAALDHPKERKVHERPTSIPHGQDNTQDCWPMDRHSHASYSSSERLSRASDGASTDHSRNDEEQHSQVPMPTSATGMTTFAHERALRTRIRASKLVRDGEYDMKKYTPTFIHDCLMLPGSLANLLGKSSAEDIIHRMTPALLHGFRACIHPEDQKPCLLPSADSLDYVQGMVIFGQGRAGRDRIHEHYRPHARRVKAQVEIDVLVPAPSYLPEERWKLQRKTISAHLWLWADMEALDGRTTSLSRRWKLEDYLAGDLADEDDEEEEKIVSTDLDSIEDEGGSIDGDAPDAGHYFITQPWAPWSRTDVQ
ncbi:hypothetical protein BDY17DRAFT_67634 [Neohortaea acidophila]|uniref:Uncharacterized protein n=1 Tax=Neohortaea acidophila TaxID=245834 RepID=A0A6A6Q1N1_9PEZI|nr:uncharacterized protein BDY17DRAFT_67634 [Neohortaea acidophila]KAF2485931.1 hypothetical protein BDY17DRAFT_67634 [Neohortaea acidophila]